MIIMNKKELFEGAGKYWVETKTGDLGCVMENGIVFKDWSHPIGNYSDDLVNKYFHKESIIRILKPIGDCAGNLYDRNDFKVVVESNKLTPITSLDQLEEVRKKMCEKYNTKFYITNQSGEWEIRFNGFAKCVGYVDDFKIEVAHIFNHNRVGTCKNNT